MTTEIPADRASGESGQRRAHYRQEPLDFLSVRDSYYSTSDGVLFSGDAQRLKEVPDDSVDLVITDPPFNLGFDYGAGISDRLTENEYMEFTSRWLNESLRALKPGGQLYAIMPKHNDRIWRPLMPAGTQELVWVKSFINQLHRGSSTLLDGWEPIVWFIKGNKPNAFHRLMRYYGDMNWLVGPNATAESRSWTALGSHPTPRPLWLMERLILRSSNVGDIVLDPMVGSGATVVAARRLGRRFIGYDLNPQHLDLVQKRLERTSTDPVRADPATNSSLALSEFLGWVFANSKRFLPLASSARTALGRLADEYVAVPRVVLSRQLSRWGYDEMSILEQWRVDGVLIHDKGKNTTVVRFGGPPTRMFKIRL